MDQSRASSGELPPATVASGEALAALVLLGAALVALSLANSPLAGGWHALLEGALAWAPDPALASLHGWIDHAAMAVFFLAVGLELKREMLGGELADPTRRRLPVLAALLGMIAPALMFIGATRADPALLRGWAIPAATDIAFALGALALAGGHLPRSLRLFLLTVAVVDDLGAVFVIALAYSGAIAWGWLAAAAVAFAALIALGRAGVRSLVPFLAGAGVLWWLVLRAGVHPTIAGVLAGLAVPHDPAGRGGGPLVRLEHALAPVSAFAVLPAFALANAGVSLGGGAVSGAVSLAVAVALVLGKPAGILGALELGRRLGWGDGLPGASAGQRIGLALLAGIGFTMSLFLATLAFPAAPALAAGARAGVLAGSLLSAVAGIALLRFAR